MQLRSLRTPALRPRLKHSSWSLTLPGGGELHLEEESCVLDEGSEDEEDAHDDPRLDGSQALGLHGK